jgi:hypothetical protein
MPEKPQRTDAAAHKAAQDRDAIDKLPLSIMPLDSNTLKAARLVKNARLETMVELHHDKSSGSLQLRPRDIPASYPATSVQDLLLINKLAELRSYDVYSLRSSLARLGISVDKSQLELSDATRERLEKNAQEFIRPLVLTLFGDGPDAAETPELAQLLRHRDVTKVQQRLKIMSQKTGIPVQGIPDFLQSYRDIFLSTTYYRDCFDSIAPDLNRFWVWLGELKNQREVTASPDGSASCSNLAILLRNLFASTRDRLNKFKGSFETFWTDMNPQSFKTLSTQIEDSHDTMGAVLCGLGVKMRNWSATFPDNTTGSTATRINYVTVELEAGLDQLMAIENGARTKLGLPPLHGQR